MYTRCPSNTEVDRYDGHCPVCNGDPDRCPTTARDVIDAATREGRATAPDGTEYRVEDVGTYPYGKAWHDTPTTPALPLEREHDGRLLDHETGTLHYRDEDI